MRSGLWLVYSVYRWRLNHNLPTRDHPMRICHLKIRTNLIVVICTRSDSEHFLATCIVQLVSYNLYLTTSIVLQPPKKVVWAKKNTQRAGTCDYI